MTPDSHIRIGAILAFLFTATQIPSCSTSAKPYGRVRARVTQESVQSIDWKKPLGPNLPASKHEVFAAPACSSAVTAGSISKLIRSLNESGDHLFLLPEESLA